MLNLVTITEDIRNKIKLESEGAIQKISQLQGFLAGLSKSQELLDGHIAQIVRQLQEPIVPSVKNKNSKKVKNAKNKD